MSGVRNQIHLLKSQVTAFFPLRHDGTMVAYSGWLASSIMCMSDETLLSICDGLFKLAPLNLKAKEQAQFQVKWGLSSISHHIYRLYKDILYI